ncbi:helix-turn-helix domain-containing protein [Ancylobacter sp. 6x-1]|uniref:Helix-turn-helix domain-containing protein n=1 Tax=Ancylobacter crimeensis TaxID=2579147 RepID=A0ABT0DG91_9HYPH|nr:helix-turn-helix transcriptional regulator [Ancylobacter crimeensis]MCK0198974.1 helix-turn-helix domain-containing protein [Ancylobacter crimeensis]
MTAQTFKTPSGETMVVLSQADYEALVEAASEAADAAAVRSFKERIASGEEELLPSAMVDRILSGENPILVWREHRGLSARAVAEKIGIAPSFLSQIENGKREGSVETLKKIAKALGVTLDDIA